MIESVSPAVVGAGAQQLLLRPRRALTGGQFAGLFAVLGTAIAAVAAVNYGLGNAFAPLFGLADVLFVGLALRHVWRQGERGERIVVGDGALEVLREPGIDPVFRAHPLWVRLALERRHGEARVWLRSKGRQVEVGAFLAEAERIDLAARLQDLLARAGWPGRNTDNQ